MFEKFMDVMIVIRNIGIKGSYKKKAFNNRDG
jgi:hypothetical protein